MKKQYLLPVFFLLLSLAATAQTGRWTLKGTLADSTGGILQSASVTLLDTKDSTLLDFQLSDGKGAFAFPNLAQRNYLLRITHVGYRDWFEKVGSDVSDLGKITLTPRGKNLNEVVVKGERAPVTMRHDTVEFNADAFKTRPNATVEDLLKRLPGVEVESDGTVKAHGKSVQRVLVDGKEFFGTDPKMATRNLAAEAVKAVQVFDRKSEQSRFSGVDDGTREKTINLELKEDFKKGIFGTAVAGAGDQGRYTGRLNLNRFAKNEQYSLIGTLNNINQQGFTLNDYFNFSSVGSSSSGGGGPMMVNVTRGSSGSGGATVNGVAVNIPGQTSSGFVNSGSGGLNFFNQINKKTKIDGNYLLNSVKSTIDRTVDKENFLENGSYKSKQSGNTVSRTTNHRLNLNLETQLDSLSTLRWTNTGSITGSDYRTSTLTQTYGTDGALQNDGTRANYYEGTAYSLNSNLAYRRRFSKKGRSLTANLIFGLNNDKKTGNINAVNNYFGTNASSDTTRQDDRQKNGRLNYGITAFYIEPLSKRTFLEFNYTYQRNLNDSRRDVDDIKGETRTPNTQLTNRYDNQYNYHRGGLSYRYAGRALNLSTGLNIQQASLIGEFPLKDMSIARHYTNLLPNLRMMYNLASSKNLNFTYETSVQQPSLTQLQPIVDNTDPLNISTGNPDLKPEYNHQFSLNYFSFNPSRFRNFFGNAFLTYTTNKIANSQTVSDQLVTTTKPVNVPDNLQGNGFVGFGLPIQKVKGLRVNANVGVTYARSQSIINAGNNVTKTLGTNLGTRIDYRPGDVFDINLAANLSLNNATYSLQAAQNQQYSTQRYTVDANWNITPKWAISSSMNYQVLAGKGYNQEIPIWNASLTRYILKNNAGEIKFIATDMLNRNVVINRSVDVNYFQEERVRSLARYFLVTFTYTLRNKAGAGGRGPVRGGPGGRPPIMIGG